MAYFDTLNYTLANEDTKIEFDLLKSNLDRVFSIGGSGARVLPLVARNPKVLDIVDISQEQLYLCELRIEAARQLSYEEFLFFMGYRGAVPQGVLEGDNRLEFFKKLELSSSCERFWKDNVAHWTPRGFIMLGRWERHFQKLGWLFRNVLRINVAPIFEAQTLEEQQQLYKKHWNTLIVRNFLKVVASEFVFNKFLYKGHFSGAAENKTDPRAPWQFLDEQFRRIFQTQLVRKNYFFQILFLGKIMFEEGLPLEAHANIVEAVRKSKTQVNTQAGDLVKLVSQEPYDFISLSDTVSYLDQTQAANLLQNLHSDTAAGSRMVIRSFLKAPQAIDTTGWQSETDLNQWALESDGTSVYQFHIFRKS